MEALGFGIGDDLGGSVRVAAANARALAARGHEITFWCTNLIDKNRKLHETPACFEHDRVSVHYWQTYTIARWRGMLGPHWVRVPQVARKSIRTFDVVHLHEWRSFLSGRLGAWALHDDVPLVVQPQGTFLRLSAQRFLKGLYDVVASKGIIAGASGFIAATTAEADILRAAGIDDPRIAIVPNGIEIREDLKLPEKGTFRRRLRLPPNIPLILSVGRVDAVKGFDLMLRALGAIPPPAVYAVVGPDHGFGDHLRALASQLGLDARFLLTGALPEARDVMAAIVDADVFVVPSRHEAFGQVILEACLVSKPMVLSNGVGSAADFADRAALVVPPEPAAFTEAVKRLLADAELRARFGAEGRAMLDRDYRIEAVAAKLEHVYDAVISRR